MDRCMMKLYKERADRLLKRRHEDVKDQSLEYMPCTPLLLLPFTLHLSLSLYYIELIFIASTYLHP